MNQTHIIVAHGGVWNGGADKYENGMQEYVRIPQDGLSYNSLLGLIFKVVDSVSCSNFIIYSLMQAADGNNLRIKITDDDDLRHVIETNNILKFYVSPSSYTSSQNSSFRHYSIDNSFVGLLNAQNSVVQPTQMGYVQHVEADIVVSDVVTNDIGIDGYDVDWGMCSNAEDEDMNVDFDDHINDENIYDFDDDENDASCGREPNTSCGDEDVQDDMGLAATRHVRQWIIPGSEFHMSLPIEELGIDVETRDELCVGATFENKEDLHTALGLYHMVNHVEYRSPRSSKKRFTAICKDDGGCRFLLRAVCSGPVWRVTKYQFPHTCQLDLSRQSPRTVSSLVVAKYFAPHLLTEGAVLKPKEMQSQLQRKYGVQVSYGIALAGRNHAMKMTYGDHDKSFQTLPSYLYMLKKTNPGSVVDLQIDSENRFKYVYMALAASITGFLSCGRPVIVVDGTHLKGKYKGIMFVAATQDGNEQIFPLAVGIGDTENDNSWTWFFRQVRKTFGCRDDLLIVSDRHISIDHAVKTVYPGVPHGICTYHLQGNLATWGADVIAMYQKCFYSYRVQEFDKHMNKIFSVSETGAYQKLTKEIDPTRWARCKCPVRRYGFLTSNCAESLNKRFVWARKMPICALLECVRRLICHWSVERRKQALAREHELTKYAAEKLLLNDEAGRTMSVEPISVSKYNVSSGMKHYIVDLAAKQCSCREFDLDLIPCSHAVAAISKANYSLYANVSNYYKTETLARMYSNEVMPIVHEEDWDVPLSIRSIVVENPFNPRQAGRPRTSRIRSRSKSSSRGKSKKCSRCKKSCHNRLNCTEYMPLSEALEIGSNETANDAGSRKTRRPKTCSICHVSGHTRRRCPERSRQK